MENEPVKVGRVLSVAEAAYLAGIIDGEGSIGLLARPSRKCHAHQATATLSIGNTNEALVDRIVEIVGEGHIGRETRPTGWKNCQTYFLMANGMRWLLPQVLPYLVAKRRQAELVLEYLDLIRGRKGIPERDRERATAIRQEIVVLNSKGDSEERFIPRCLIASCQRRSYREHPYCHLHWLEHGEKEKGTCRQCGKEMDLKRPETQYCSAKCYRDWYYVNVGKAQIEEERASRPKHPCPVCGTPVDRSRYKSKVYCSDRCQIKAYNDSRASRGPVEPKAPGRTTNVLFHSQGAPDIRNRERMTSRDVNCRICGTEFTSTHPTQCYCSKDCQRKGKHLKT